MLVSLQKHSDVSYIITYIGKFFDIPIIVISIYTPSPFSEHFPAIVPNILWAEEGKLVA